MAKTKAQEFKIERDVPMPHGARFPFHAMEVGESFSVPEGTVGTVRSSAWMAGNGTGRKFSVRKTPEGYRCWRIA